jgi:hypothetical protein
MNKSPIINFDRNKMFECSKYGYANYMKQWRFKYIGNCYINHRNTDIMEVICPECGHIIYMKPCDAKDEV